MTFPWDFQASQGSKCGDRPLLPWYLACLNCSQHRISPVSPCSQIWMFPTSEVWALVGTGVDMSAANFDTAIKPASESNYACNQDPPFQNVDLLIASTATVLFNVDTAVGMM